MTKCGGCNLMELQHELGVNRRLLIALETETGIKPPESTKAQLKFRLDKIILNLKLISDKLEREIKQELFEKEMKYQNKLEFIN